jgi:hypothetical protein
MSLEIRLGAERNIFEESPEHAVRVILSSPVISPAMARIDEPDRPGFERHLIDMNPATTRWASGARKRQTTTNGIESRYGEPG